MLQILCLKQFWKLWPLVRALLNPGLPNGRRGGKDFQKKITAWDAVTAVTAWDAVSMRLAVVKYGN